MIPEYLKEKSAAQIVVEQREMFIATPYYNAEERIKDRITQLETLLLLAIKDALCNVDGETLCDGDYGLMGSEAECRAIAFLNTVLPKE